MSKLVVTCSKLDGFRSNTYATAVLPLLTKIDEKLNTVSSCLILPILYVLFSYLRKFFLCVVFSFEKYLYIYHCHPSLTKTCLLKNQLFMLLSQLLCQNVMVVS